MGGDGGVHATKRRFMRGAKDSDAEQDKLSVKKNQKLRATICTQSSERLQEPIVCCELGNLYSKEAIVTALINKAVNISCAHVRGLKDLKTLKFTPNPGYCVERETEGEIPAMYICPVTKTEFNGLMPFVAIWTTGYVLSAQAVRELGIKALQAEYGPFTGDDIIKLLPNDEDGDEQLARMVSRRNHALESKSHKRSLEKNGKSNHPRKHKKKGTEGQEVVTNNGKSSDAGYSRTSLSNSSSLVKSAAQAIQGQESQSNVFKELFHSDKDNLGKNATTSNDLFRAVAGIRYTIG